MENRSAPRFEGAGPVLVRIPLAPMGTTAATETGGPALVSAAPEMLRARIDSLLKDPVLREGVTLASPSTALTCRQPLAELPDKRLRALAGSLTAYATRMRARATPFGVFAGVALAPVANESRGWIGGPQRHRRIVRPDSALLDAVVEQVERSEEGLLQLRYIVNPSVRSGERGYLLMTPDARTSRVVLPASASLTAVLETAALGAAEGDTTGARLLDRAMSEGESQQRAAILLRTLVKRRFLLSDLRPPAHDLDPLRHVLDRLKEHRLRPDLVRMVERLDASVRAYAAAPVGLAAEVLDSAHEAAAEVLRGAGADPEQQQEGSPLHVDTALDADIAFGSEVIEEARRAATVLARFARFPDQQQLQRHLKQVSGGFAVPLLDVSWTREPPLSRERTTPPRLLAAYTEAVRDRQPEIELDDELLDAIAPEAEADLVTELDLFAVVAAPTAKALDQGRFELHIRRPATTSAGTALARFVPALGEAGTEALECIQRRTDQAASADERTISADVTFRPRQPGAGNTARTALVRASRITTNAPVASRTPPGTELSAQDLLLFPGTDGPQVWSQQLGTRVLPRATTALNTENTAPHSAHLLAVATGQNCALRFDWGGLADSPWLPRVRRGRTVLWPQTWRPGEDLTGTADGTSWRERFAAWCARWGVPDLVTLVDGDRQMPLRLSDPVDLDFLRRQARRGPVVLIEALSEEHCWVRSLQGSHLLEAVFSMAASAPQASHKPGGARPVPGGPPPRRPSAPTPVPPGGEWLRARLTCPQGGQRRLLRALTQELAGHDWLFTRPELVGLMVCVRPPSSPDGWRSCLGRLSAALETTGQIHDADALTVLTYARDAGFGVVLPLPESAERWAVADTRCALAALAREPDQVGAVLSTVALAREIARASGHRPLNGVEPDRPGFAPIHRTLMPLLISAEAADPAAEQAQEEKASLQLTNFYLKEQQDQQTAAIVGGLLLRQHAARLVGVDQAPALLSLASAAQLATESFHRAQRRST